MITSKVKINVEFRVFEANREASLNYIFYRFLPTVQSEQKFQFLFFFFWLFAFVLPTEFRTVIS